jgi:GNAT superfamily N-acetyltransferase
VATAALVEREEPDDAFGPWLASVYTLPPARERGIARALIVSAEAEAQRLGHRRLLLATSIPRFYQAIGWSQTGIERSGEIVMEKEISS